MLLFISRGCLGTKNTTKVHPSRYMRKCCRHEHKQMIDNLSLIEKPRNEVREFDRCPAPKEKNEVFSRLSGSRAERMSPSSPSYGREHTSFFSLTENTINNQWRRIGEQRKQQQQKQQRSIESGQLKVALGSFGRCRLFADVRFCCLDPLASS